MTAAPLAAAAIAAIWLAGVPSARVLGLRGPLAAAAAWLLGGALLVLLMIAANLCGLRFSRPLLALLWCVAAFAPRRLLILLGRVPPQPVMRGRRRRARYARGFLPELLSLLICVFQLCFCTLQALRVPLGSFDAWALWEYKGRRFWLDGGLSAGFLHDRAAIFAHPGYPPLVPLLISWVYTWTGEANPVLMKAIFPLFFVTLLLAFYAALRCSHGRTVALTATALLALVPRIAEYAGTGLADVPMAAALVACAASLAQWRIDRRERTLLAAALLLAVALWIKHDAVVFTVVALIAVAVPERNWRAASRFVLAAAVVTLPWYGYVALTQVPERDFLSLTPQHLLQHLDRLGSISRFFALNLLAFDEWSILWVVFLALLLRCCLRRRIAAPLLLLAVLLPLALYVFSLSLSAWPDYTLHVRTSVDRLILVVTPFALWWMVEQVRTWRVVPPRRSAQ